MRLPYYPKHTERSLNFHVRGNLHENFPSRLAGSETLIPERDSRTLEILNQNELSKKKNFVGDVISGLFGRSASRGGRSVPALLYRSLPGKRRRRRSARNSLRGGSGSLISFNHLSRYPSSTEIIERVRVDAKTFVEDFPDHRLLISSCCFHITK